VPMFTWGFERSNFSLAMGGQPYMLKGARGPRL